MVLLIVQKNEMLICSCDYPLTSSKKCQTPTVLFSVAVISNFLSDLLKSSYQTCVSLLVARIAGVPMTRDKSQMKEEGEGEEGR